jgi:uncharacterized protein (TIGR03435 family)
MARTFPFAALLAVPADCWQAKAPAPPTATFEVAAIKPCEPGTPEPPEQRMGMARFTFPGGRFEAHATTAEFLVEWAYGLMPSQHSRGPAWMENDRFDIIAKAAGNATDEEMKLMAQALLTDQFHLKFHYERRQAPVLVLSLGKNAPKLSPPKEGEPHGLKLIPQMDRDQKIVSYHVLATRFSFKQLDLTFARQLERVIVNETGIDGDFDFTLDFTPDENRPNPLDASIVVNAIRDQLGLTVTAQKRPLDFLVIDDVQKVADGN